MGQIGADHDQRLGSAPAHVEDRRDLVRRGVADGERQQREVVEHALEERELHLEAVFVGVSAIVDPHTGHLEGGVASVDIDRHDAERRLERIDAGDSEAAHVHAVTRPEEDNSPNRRSGRDEPSERACGDRARVHVSGVGHDERLRNRRVGGWDHSIGECLAYRRAQRVGGSGIERPGDRRRTHSHGPGTRVRTSSSDHDAPSTPSDSAVTG